ncbi:MAG: Beta-ketoacyl synthase, N-terminal domain [Glomeribacter sp. 1016415]|nr:Beta-ketoacyl synthase, N-terminal domain [Glomeribacter sp. 1016415]
MVFCAYFDWPRDGLNTEFLTTTLAGQSNLTSVGSDGVLFGEGAGAVLLKRLSKAIKDQANILAVIESTVVNHVGNVGSSNIPAPEVISRVIKNNMTKSGIDPRTFSPQCYI